MSSRQLGKFTISRYLIENDTEFISDVFSALKLIPVRSELMFHNDTMEYIAISKYFREVPMGSEIPEYVFNFTRNRDAELIEFKDIEGGYKKQVEVNKKYPEIDNMMSIE